MQPQKVWAVYFSGTGTTEKTVRRIASSLAAAFSAPLEAVDFTAPAVRKEALTFGPDDLVVLGRPCAQCPPALSHRTDPRRRHTGGTRGPVWQPRFR